MTWTSWIHILQGDPMTPWVLHSLVSWEISVLWIFQNHKSSVWLLLTGLYLALGNPSEKGKNLQNQKWETVLVGGKEAAG